MTEKKPRGRPPKPKLPEGVELKQGDNTWIVYRNGHVVYTGCKTNCETYIERVVK